MVPLDFSGSSLSNASLTLMERPCLLTSHKRTKRVGIRIVSAVHKLDDRVPDYLHRFIYRRAGERQESSRFSSSRLSRYPPIAGLITRPPTAGVGSAGS